MVDIAGGVRPKCRKTACGGGYRGNTTGEAQWLIGFRDGGPGNRRPSPSYATGQSVDVAGGWARKMAGSGRVFGAVVHLSKIRRLTRAARQGARSPTGPQTLGAGDLRPTVGRGQMISRRLSALSCSLYRQTEVATFALPGRCSGVTRVISARHLPLLPPTT